MSETETRFVVTFEPGFPLEDVMSLAQELTASGILAPGFIPPPAGLLRPDAIVYAKDQQGYDTIILPDRNLVSRMTRVARQGHADLKDPTTRSALALMAYCQAMNLNFDPGVAFHELGAVSGNAVARDELSWFRAADRGAARDWVALAAGHQDRVNLGGPAPVTDLDFAKPLARWRRNYVVALKAAALELEFDGPPIERALALFDWMDRDFLLAGPAAMFTTMFFGPRAERAGLFKQLYSPNREAAIEGVRNAAWDMTHLSEFSRRVSSANECPNRYIFASGDLKLVRIASRLFLGPVPADGWPSLEESLSEWWSEADARRLADTVFARFDTARFKTRALPTFPAGDIDARISAGEMVLQAWTPPKKASASD